MELNKEKIRLLLHFQRELDFNASEAARNINKVYGDDICSVRTAQRWFSAFASGDESLADKSRSGRPREVHCHAVINAIEDSPSMTSRMLAEDFDCDHALILNILHEAGKC